VKEQPSAPLQALLDVLCGRDTAASPQLDAAGWDTFVAEAARHGVSALAYRALASGGSAPAHVVRLLEQHYLRNRLRNLRLYARLSQLLQVLTAESIAAVVLKGAYLAQAVYGDTALRAMSDIDLLVRERDLERAAKTLRGQGWNQTGSSSDGGHQLPSLEHDGVAVDLHWSIEDDAAPFQVDAGGMLQRAVPFNVGPGQGLALAREDLLLHLCLHTAYNHGWLPFDGGLRHLADLAAVVRQDSTLDWGRLSARANQWRITRCVWLALTAARALLQARVPDGVFEGVTPTHREMLDMACRLALGTHQAELVRRLPAFGRSWTNKHWRRLSSAARWRQHAFPPRASLQIAYPRLAKHTALARVALWKDLAGEAAAMVADPVARELRSFEHSRRAMIEWMEAG
jgi:hypothetical protein